MNEYIKGIIKRLTSTAETLCMIQNHTNESTASILDNQIGVLVMCQQDLLNILETDKKTS